MSSIVSVRIAGPEDIPTIGFLAQQIWPSTYKDILSAGQIDYMLNLFYHPDSLNAQMFEKNHVFVMEEDEDEQPLGFASYSLIKEPDIFKLHKLYVLPGLQGKGLGKLMLDFIAEQITSQGASALQVNVNRHNKATHFYEKLGFAVIGEEDIDIGNNYWMNDYIMEKKL